MRGRPPGSADLVTRLAKEQFFTLANKHGDPMEFLFEVMADSRWGIELRILCATRLLPYGYSRQASLKLDTDAGGDMQLTFADGPEVEQLADALDAH